MCQVEIVQGYRYSVRIIVRFLFVVRLLGGTAKNQILVHTMWVDAQ